MANFPGFIQLQAGLLNGLGTAKTWKDLAAADLDAARRHSPWHNLPLQLDQLEWGVPAQSVLDQAVELRRALDGQRDTDLASFADKLLLVVGKADFTPAGYKKSDDGVVYLDAPDDGDGRVPLRQRRAAGRGHLGRRRRARLAAPAQGSLRGYRELLSKAGRIASRR